ncbi:MAG: hypothetical protein RL885_20580 [Planctomycetota bacterium]
MNLVRCLLVLGFALAACDSGGEPPAHSHTAPHGGTLVPLGDHFANVELVWDSATGRLEAFILGPHASQAVRITAEKLDLTLGDRSIVLHAVESALSGETVGDTSAFAGELVPRQDEAPPLGGSLTRIEVFGQTFENVAFELEPASDANQDSRESSR